MYKCQACGKPHYRKTRQGEPSPDCANCHAEATHKPVEPVLLTPDQDKKQRVRAITATLIRRGRIKRQPCQCCGAQNSQCHHLDYDKPTLVGWLCRECHAAEHATGYVSRYAQMLQRIDFE